MKIITYTTQRIILTPDEKRIAKSWGPQWRQMTRAHLKGEKIRLIIGVWSGYKASQRRPVHISLAPKDVPDGHLGTIVYGDNTTMETTVSGYTLHEILHNQLTHMDSYQGGVNRMLLGEKVVTY